MLLEAAVFLTVLYRLSSQNLAISNKNVQLSTIGDMYLSIQDIDLRADSIQLIRKRHGNDEDDLVGSGQTSARGMLKKVCEGVDEESKPVMELFVDLDTLPERLTNADTLAVEYLSDQQLWCRARFIVADRDANGNVVRVLWLIESIDEEKKHRDELKSLSETDPMTGVRSKHAFPS